MEQNKNEKIYYTYGMIKPDGMEHKEEIVRMILKAGFKIDYYKCEMLSDELIDENYGHVKEKYPEDFKLLKQSLKSGPVLMMLIYDPEGNAVEKYRRILGVTKSWEADPNSIRGRFGDKSKVYKNAAHGSGNTKEANEEIIRFFGQEMASVLDSVSSARTSEFLYQSEGRKLCAHPRCTYNDEFVENTKVENINNACDDYAKKMGL